MKRKRKLGSVKTVIYRRWIMVKGRRRYPKHAKAFRIVLKG